MLPLTGLLPLRSVAVTLRFLDSSSPAFFHQPALGAFLRHLAGSPEGFERLLRFDAPESGRIAYRPGQFYRFHLVGLGGGEAVLETLLGNLARLPGGSPRSGHGLPFRDNLALAAVHDGLTGQPAADFQALSIYDAATLEEEAELWGGFDRFTWQFLSPARLLKDKARREQTRGEARYCRNLCDVDGALLTARLHDSLAELLRARGAEVPSRPAPPALRVEDGHLFWLDAMYYDMEGKGHVMGGMSGRLELALDEPPAAEWWQQAILGQYVGIGQRGAFGLGRYRLQSPEGGFSVRRVLPAASLLSLARDEGNLADAWRHIRTNRSGRRPASAPVEEWEWDEDPPVADEPEADEDFPLLRLQRAFDRALAGDYRPPSLMGVVLPTADGGVRPLAVPPFFDRVLQRAVAQIVAPALDAAQYRHSYGFRPGRSRENARDAIQKAAREGYGWVYESDIDDFFDSVDPRRLEVRLRALYGEDPAVDLILAWMTRPVEYESQTIARPVGLPQGSPLSPAMANLMLDDFDGDMEALGFKLVRFADDFVVLCKNPGQAEQAHAAARASLVEHGLRLNPEKTRIASTEQGFRYLGYLFVNDLAVDVSGHGEETPDAPHVPPRSWLARLGVRTPRPLASGGTAAPAAAETAGSAQSAPNRPPSPIAACGRMDDLGQLLCVTGSHARLSSHAGRLRVERGGETVSELAWNNLHAVLLFGSHTLTTPALHAALAHGVPVHFAGAGGGYRGVLWTGRPTEAGSGLWLRQASLFVDPDLALGLAKEIVAARIRHLRETVRLRGATEAALRLKSRLTEVESVSGLEGLNGLEGAATNEFFDAVQGWLSVGWGFSGRNRRPPRDPFNALLSMGYTVLHGYVQTLIHADGLLPWQGFYHQPHGRHATLASDLMEPFRHLVERTALTLIQRRELDPGDFYAAADGACLLKAAARRHFLAILLECFNTPVTAYRDDTATTPLQHIHRQNLSLIRWLTRGERFQAWRTR
jgi:group II intron reverse transcriptase/maturase/CRISPR-associated endonuclease Cas1